MLLFSARCLLQSSGYHIFRSWNYSSSKTKFNLGLKRNPPEFKRNVIFNTSKNNGKVAFRVLLTFVNAHMRNSTVYKNGILTFCTFLSL